MLATVATFAAAAYLAVALVALAPRKPGYSHARHSISELGETGAPHQRLVAFGVFAPIGLALLGVAAFANASMPHAPAIAALALCIAVGYLGAAVFPCDPGSPMWGSPRQFLHNVAGAVEYAGGAFSLLTLARDFGAVFQVAGMVVAAATIGLSVLPANAGRGAVQRVAEACLFGGLALALWLAGAAAAP